MSAQIQEVHGSSAPALGASAKSALPTKAKPGASWKANEQHVLPKNNIPLVFSGLMLCVFLAALDQVGCRVLDVHSFTLHVTPSRLGGFTFARRSNCIDTFDIDHRGYGASDDRVTIERGKEL